MNLRQWLVDSTRWTMPVTVTLWVRAIAAIGILAFLILLIVTFYIMYPERKRTITLTVLSLLLAVSVITEAISWIILPHYERQAQANIPPVGKVLATRYHGLTALHCQFTGVNEKTTVRLDWDSTPYPWHMNDGHPQLPTGGSTQPLTCAATIDGIRQSVTAAPGGDTTITLYGGNGKEL